MKILVVPIIVFTLSCCVLGDVYLTLLVGWAFFLARVVPALHINIEGLLVALVCLLGLVGGLQSFMQRLMSRRSTLAGAQITRWRFRWTLGILGLVIMMFVAGISAVGIVHQAGWLAQSPQPIFKRDSFRLAAARITSNNNAHQMALAAYSYADDHNTFPPGALFNATGEPLHGWQTLLLPYLEEEARYKKIDLQKAWNDPANVATFRCTLKVFIRPEVEPRTDSDGFGLSHYAGNAQLLGGAKKWARAQITDGTSKTLLLGEANGNFKPWGSPTNWRDPALGLNKTPDGFGNSRGGDVTFAMADGSIRTLNPNISPQVLKALSTPDAGDEVGPDF
jgi:hypothetical protein